MRKIIYLIALLVLLAPPARAQEKEAESGQAARLTAFEGDVRLGYRWNNTKGNPMAGEYEYQHSSAAGSAIIEYDPLPNRFLFESYVQNSKDYFTEFDYSFKDILMLSMTARSLFHNLDHYSIGQSIPGGMTVTDQNPNDEYGTSNAMNRAQVRFKTPDFPFHIYLEAKNQERQGTVQQRFMNSFTDADKMSRSRTRDFETDEAKATINSHLAWVEVEYSHATKKFKDTANKVLYDTSSVTYAHNLVPTLESTTDTIKVHTSHTGRVAAAVTYATGDKENKDSLAKSDFTNAAADFSWIPDKDVTVSVRWRRHEVDPSSPDSAVADTPAGPATYTVRSPIGYTRDVLAAMVRYRASKNLTLRAEAGMDNLARDLKTGSSPTPWELDENVDKTFVRLGATYRVTNRVMLRGDLGRVSATIPANSVDNTYPETSDQVRLTATWSPKTWMSMLLSAATVREERSGLNAPFTEKWTNERDRILGSFTFLVGKQTAVTPSYSFFQNRHTGPIAYADPSSAIYTETGVPYADTAHIASLAVSHAIADALILTVDVARSWSRGNWQTSGAYSDSNGIAEFSSLNVVDTWTTADLEVRVTDHLGYNLRYQIRRLDDKLDDAQDGTNQIAMALLSWKW